MKTPKEYFGDYKQWIGLHDILGAVAYSAFHFNSLTTIRNFNVVMDKCRAYIIEHFETPLPFDETYYVETFTYEEYEQFVREMLMSIPEFIDWNISEEEHEKGFCVENWLNENLLRKKTFTFITAMTPRTKEDLVHDFVDLEAFIQFVIVVTCRMIF